MKTLRFNSPLMASDLKGWGVVPRKTYIGVFPDDIPDELLPHFVRGLWDGDGCIGSGKNARLGFANNEGVVWEVQRILRNIGVRANDYVVRHNEKTGHITRVLQVAAKEHIQSTLLWLQYDNPDVPALPRKRERALHILSGRTDWAASHSA